MISTVIIYILHLSIIILYVNIRYFILQDDKIILY